MSNKNLRIDGLDFDDIKTNLKEYLRSQDKFKDFDFEGSGMNIILDLLSYNTHYQAFYSNMVANEAFLDSSVLRPSVVSIAKQLGYVPRSTKASKVFLDVFFDGTKVTNSGETLKELVLKSNAFVNKGDIFRASLPNNNFYNFTVLEDYKIDFVSDDLLVCRDVKAYEGVLRSYTFVVNTFDPTQRYILPSKNIDIETLKIRIKKSTNDTTGLLDIWNRATDITGLTSNSLVYFIQESEQQNFEIYFGDGIIGKALENGNVISLEYLLTNGESANDCIDFEYVSGVLASFTQRVSTIVGENGKLITSYGGALPESIDSIKYYAPRNYQAQDRAVTTEDYKTLLVKEFSDSIDSFFVWGGEENDPPAYGKVFISIKPKNGNKIGILEKIAIQKSILGRRNLVTIQPEIVDPDYLYLEISSVSAYEPSKTNLSPTALSYEILQTVTAFESKNLYKFGKNFKASRLTSSIDSTNNSIEGTELKLKLQKRIEPFLKKPSPYTLKFENPLLHPIDGYFSIISSSSFGYQDSTSSAVTKPIVDCYLDDDGYGNIRIFKAEGSNKIYINKNIGKIDYKKGILSLNQFNPQYIVPSSASEISITAVPSHNDVLVSRNKIIIVDYSKSNFSVNLEKIETKKQTGTSFPYSI